MIDEESRIFLPYVLFLEYWLEYLLLKVKPVFTLGFIFYEAAYFKFLIGINSDATKHK